MIPPALGGLRLAKAMASLSVIVHLVPQGEYSLCGVHCRVLERPKSPKERLCLSCLRELNNRPFPGKPATRVAIPVPPGILGGGAAVHSRPHQGMEDIS